MYSGDRAPGSKDTTTEGLDRPRRLQRGGGLVNRLDSNRQMVEGEGWPGLPGWDGSHMGSVSRRPCQERSEAGREGAWPQGPLGGVTGALPARLEIQRDSSQEPRELRLLWEEQVETELESRFQRAYPVWRDRAGGHGKSSGALGEPRLASHPPWSP